MGIRVSLIEDDADIRESIAFMIKKSSEFCFTGSYPTAEDGLASLALDPPDIVLMDINLPGMSGVDCARELTAKHPNLIILMLTVYEDTDAIFRSLTAGASGYLLKRTPAPELLEAIRQAHSGSSPMSGHIARKVVQYFHQSAPPRSMEALSARESEVLACLAKGYIYKEIGEQLGITLDTVRKHLGKVYQKLHVKSRTEAVVKYLGK